MPPRLRSTAHLSRGPRTPTGPTSPASMIDRSARPHEAFRARRAHSKHRRNTAETPSRRHVTPGGLAGRNTAASARHPGGLAGRVEPRSPKACTACPPVHHEPRAAAMAARPLERSPGESLPNGSPRPLDPRPGGLSIASIDRTPVGAAPARFGRRDRTSSPNRPICPAALRPQPRRRVVGDAQQHALSGRLVGIAQRHALSGRLVGGTQQGEFFGYSRRHHTTGRVFRVQSLASHDNRPFRVGLLASHNKVSF
jgi:hypothetical protein